MVSENDDFSFGDLKGQIAKFKTVQAAHNEKLDSWIKSLVFLFVKSIQTNEFCNDFSFFMSFFNCVPGKKTELEQKKALCEQIARELESLESEICTL